ncbi:hypothetical protein HMPREF0868_0164 [Mageeibacillus indolicus UPII9-5]|uniref:Uncharacterized protein n=1 Tax=Mageeibacillus indolicus (strain UPII9-5) TaxID=699246 RepID=D3R001_MAGIU|nr:hypothetical protein HMPREF0868_0164 [Mageeibacillus indolicus UPII9-5]
MNNSKLTSPYAYGEELYLYLISPYTTPFYLFLKTGFISIFFL